MAQQRSKPQTIRHSFHLTGLILIAAALAAVLMGCAPQIGDACETDDDCPDAAYCDTSVEDGFCTISDCSPGDCPSESICVDFDRHERYCLKSCTVNEDCRPDHRCVDDLARQARYCFVRD